MSDANTLEDEMKIAVELMKDPKTFKEGIYLKAAIARSMRIAELEKELEQLRLERDIKDELYQKAIDRIVELAIKLGECNAASRC